MGCARSTDERIKDVESEVVKIGTLATRDEMNSHLSFLMQQVGAIRREVDSRLDSLKEFSTIESDLTILLARAKLINQQLECNGLKYSLTTQAESWETFLASNSYWRCLYKWQYAECKQFSIAVNKQPQALLGDEFARYCVDRQPNCGLDYMRLYVREHIGLLEDLRQSYAASIAKPLPPANNPAISRTDHT